MDNWVWQAEESFDNRETVEVPLVDRWRLPYLCFLLAQRSEAHNMVMEAYDDGLEELINSLVTN